MSDFADELGSGYLNLVVRRLGQRLATAGDEYMRQHGVTVSATSTAILNYVGRYDQTSIADIAGALGYTHQSVAKTIAVLEEAELTRSSVSNDDLRVRCVSLTRKGRQEVARIEIVADRAQAVFEEIFDEIGNDLFTSLRRFETALDQRPLLCRLQGDEPFRTHRRPQQE